jgi:hypothetical protein
LFHELQGLTVDKVIPSQHRKFGHEVCAKYERINDRTMLTQYNLLHERGLEAGSSGAGARCSPMKALMAT